MTDHKPDEAPDATPLPAQDDLPADAMPAVAYPDRPWVVIAGALGALALGGIVFGSIYSAQQTRAVDGIVPTRDSAQDTGLGAPVPAPPDIFAQTPDPYAVTPPMVPENNASVEEQANWSVPVSPPPPPPPPPAPMPNPYPPQAANFAPVAPSPPPPPVPAVRPASDLGQRLRSPALIIDLSPAANATEAAANAAAASPGDNDAFSARVGNADTPTARAGTLRNPRTTVPQGAIIAAVLETAINSDLPGFVRAIVSRDVTSFDGTRVLIPRGSRLVGQYKSEVALGQSRAFVVWTRLLRPDGVSVQLASPGTDTLGRAGLDGKVDRHFLQRYGPGLLTTLITSALSNGNGSGQLVIGTAQNMAGAAVTGENIKPTVSVRQGTAIQVFVARDLDFTTPAAGPRP